jgi:hypothetical protein
MTKTNSPLKEKKERKGTLNLEKIRELVELLPKQEEKAWFLVSPKIKKYCDKVWKQLPWYIKLWINIKRLFNGVGLYE